tara:strand:- start:3273 stop:3641 length:369 start_codon:yes stop_codon:yes gene_type:complete
MANIDTLVEELGKLTVLEAGELAKKLSKEWNIDLDNLAQAGAPAQAAAEAPSELKKITLKSFKENSKIPVIKVVRSILDLGLLEAKNFVEALPKEIKSDLEKEEADKIVKDLEAAGGEVEVK